MLNETTPLRVLVADDDAGICELLADYLEQYGWTTGVVADALGIYNELEKGSYDALILDLMMPGENGLCVCRKIRQRSSMPILMLTARGEVTDRVVGLELGADDYLVKPFDPRELVARLQAIVRRSRFGAQRRSDTIEFGGWRLNRTLRQLVSAENVVKPLSNAEFRLLMVFLERPKQVLSRNQLLDFARGRDVEAIDRSIDLLVSRLRQKLLDDPKQPRLLKTIRHEGYYLDAKVVLS